jgi:predicted alpha/beta-fold hydrolase
MPASIFPEKEELSESIVYEVGHYGGHVGFIEGSLFKPVFWLEKRVTRFFKEL